MKKLPPWALVATAVAAGALFWLLKQRRDKLKQEAEASESESSVSASEAPVFYTPGEGEYGGAPGGGSGAAGGGGLGNAFEAQSELSQLFSTFEQGQVAFETQQQESWKQFEKEQQEGFAKLAQSSGTVSQGSGGGAPESNKKGVVSAPSTPVTCGKSFPGFPNANGGVSKSTCYKNISCGNGCPGHKYADGHAECQTKNKGKCSW